MCRLFQTNVFELKPLSYWKHPVHSLSLSVPWLLVYPRSIIPDPSDRGSGYLPSSDRPTSSQTAMDQLDGTTATPTGHFGELDFTSVYQVRPAWSLVLYCYSLGSWKKVSVNQLCSLCCYAHWLCAIPLIYSVIIATWRRPNGYVPTQFTLQWIVVSVK